MPVDAINQFQAVTFAKERANTFLELGAKKTILVCYAFDPPPIPAAGTHSLARLNPLIQSDPTMRQLSFRVERVEGERLSLETLAPVRRLLKPNETVELLFGLGDGQYMLHARVERVERGLTIVHPGGELFKIQRRENFRVSIPLDMGMKFKLSSINNRSVEDAREKKKFILLIPLDLSAGGVRLRWIGQGLPTPSVGDQLAVHFEYSTGKSLEVFGSIKTVLDLDHAQQQLTPECAVEQTKGGS